MPLNSFVFADDFVANLNFPPRNNQNKSVKIFKTSVSPVHSLSKLEEKLKVNHRVDKMTEKSSNFKENSPRFKRKYPTSSKFEAKISR